ncbi:MAG: cobalt ECF transporter T component CbiQ [Desulfomonile sp.]|nr:cobalt ECF transporter T component CbiQ [Desulfomonile sp.]
MFDLFSDIFARSDNALTRVDTRVKLIIALSAIVAVMFSSRGVLPLGICVLCIWVMLALGLPLRIVILRLAGPLGIAVVLVVLQGFFTKGSPVFQLTVLGTDIAATREGLWKGTLLASRVLGSMSVVMLLGAVTPAYKVFHALRWWGVPESWVEIALLVYRYTFVLLDQAADVAEAQRVRLGYSSLRRSLDSVGILAGTVITRSLEQAMRTHEAMVLRGYDGGICFGPLPGIAVQDRRCLVVALPALFAVYALIEWWPM